MDSPPELPTVFAVANAVSRFRRGVVGLRQKVSVIERELIGKVYADPRFSDGANLLASHIRSALDGCEEKTGTQTDGTFLTGVDAASEDAPRSAANFGDSAAGPPPKKEVDVTQFSLEALLVSWSRALVQICLEDWELDAQVSKLGGARSQIEKLDKEKIDAHRQYMQELQSIRDRMTRLERGVPIEFVIPVDDLTFYEPTAFLEPDLRQLVKEIVEYKVRQELTRCEGFKDKTEDFLFQLKEKDATIAELRERIKELEEDSDERLGSKPVAANRRGTSDDSNLGGNDDARLGRRRSMVGVNQNDVVHETIEVVKPTKCDKCGGPLAAGYQEALAEIEALRELLAQQDGNKEVTVHNDRIVDKVVRQEVHVEGDHIQWRSDDVRLKRLQLKMLKLQKADCLNDMQEIAVDIELAETNKMKPTARRFCMLAERLGHPIASAKDRATAAKLLRDEEKALPRKLRDIEKNIAKLDMYDIDNVDFMDHCVQTDDVAEPSPQQVVVTRTEVGPPVEVEREPVLRQLGRVHDEEELRVQRPPKQATPPPTPPPEKDSSPRRASVTAAPRQPVVKQEVVVVQEKVTNVRAAPAGDGMRIEAAAKGKDIFKCLERCSELGTVLRGQHSEAAAGQGLRADIGDRLQETLTALESNLRTIRRFAEEVHIEAKQLREKNAKLQQQNSQFTIALNEMQEKLKEAQKQLREAGLGDIADQIFNNVGLDKIITNVHKPVSVFERLYRDAMSRLRRDPDMKKVNRSKHKAALVKTLKTVFKRERNNPDDDYDDYDDEDDGGFICPHCGKEIEDPEAESAPASPRSPRSPRSAYNSPRSKSKSADRGNRLGFLQDSVHSSSAEKPMIQGIGLGPPSSQPAVSSGGVAKKSALEWFGPPAGMQISVLGRSMSPVRSGEDGGPRSDAHGAHGEIASAGHLLPLMGSRGSMGPLPLVKGQGSTGSGPGMQTTAGPSFIPGSSVGGASNIGRLVRNPSAPQLIGDRGLSIVTVGGAVPGTHSVDSSTGRRELVQEGERDVRDKGSSLPFSSTFPSSFPSTSNPYQAKWLEFPPRRPNTTMQKTPLTSMQGESEASMHTVDLSMPWHAPERTFSAPALHQASRPQSGKILPVSPQQIGSLPRLEGSGLLHSREAASPVLGGRAEQSRESPLSVSVGRLELSASSPLLPTVSIGSPEASRPATNKLSRNLVEDVSRPQRKPPASQELQRRTSVPKLVMRGKPCELSGHA